jgi:hypothetical protein
MAAKTKQNHSGSPQTAAPIIHNPMLLANPIMIVRITIKTGVFVQSAKPI